MAGYSGAAMHRSMLRSREGAIAVYMTRACWAVRTSLKLTKVGAAPPRPEQRQSSFPNSRLSKPGIMASCNIARVVRKITKESHSPCAPKGQVSQSDAA